MGTTESTAGLASALFSRVQLRVLGLFLGAPSRTYQVREVIKLVGSGRGAVQRELKKLTAAGILIASTTGARKVYQANLQSPIHGELSGIILKTVGLLEPLRKALKKFAPTIDVAFVYGSVAKGKDTAKSDIDLMIIGDDISYSEIFGALQKAEKTLARPINPNLMSPAEWKAKSAHKSSFIIKISQQPKLFIFGNEDELKGIEQSRQGRRTEA
jgi:predicted nucleotidyltransferase